MKSYAEIAQETDTSIEQVRNAMHRAQTSDDTRYAKWFVSVGRTEWTDSYDHAGYGDPREAVGRGDTREAAVIDALERNPGMFR